MLSGKKKMCLTFDLFEFDLIKKNVVLHALLTASMADVLLGIVLEQREHERLFFMCKDHCSDPTMYSPL